MRSGLVHEQELQQLLSYHKSYESLPVPSVWPSVVDFNAMPALRKQPDADSPEKRQKVEIAFQ